MSKLSFPNVTWALSGKRESKRRIKQKWFDLSNFIIALFFY